LFFYVVGQFIEAEDFVIACNDGVVNEAVEGVGLPEYFAGVAVDNDKAFCGEFIIEV